jgi:hypothetical protein
MLRQFKDKDEAIGISSAGKKVSENRCQTVQRFQVIEIEIEPIASNCYQLLVFEFR